jgi:hypothetical protein
MTRRPNTSYALTSACGVIASAYLLALRERLNRWGATNEEVTEVLPGDELPAIYGDRGVSTRAITIDASPEEVWPWLVQMGSGRAGFYTHEWVERLVFITYAEAKLVRPEERRATGAK